MYEVLSGKKRVQDVILSTEIEISRLMDGNRDISLNLGNFAANIGEVSISNIKTG